MDDSVLASLAAALDCDLGLSPLTNTMPVLRSGLLRGGGPVALVVAWVLVRDLAVYASQQRYTFARAMGDGGAVVRFEAPDDGFETEIAFDGDGVVVEYPGIGWRLG